MGEKVEAAKNDGEKKAGDAGQKKDDGAVTAVFKIDMHCDGCAKKVKRVVKHLNGVSDVKADPSSNKLTVTGKVDPAVIKTKLEQKMKRKIEIVSPQLKKEGGGDKKPDEKTEKKTDEKAEKKTDGKGEKKADGKSEKKSDEKAEKKPEEKKSEEKKTEKKPDEKKSEEKKAKESTVVLKMRLHCEGCIQKIRKALIKFKGVNEISMDAQKDLVTVKGTIEGKDLQSYLKDKFNRSVEVVPPKKEEPAAGGEKKEKEAGGGGGGGGGDKKENDGKSAASSGGDGGGAKVEVSKYEYNGFSYPPSTFYYDTPAHSHAHQYSYAMEAQPSYPVHGFANSSGYYANQNYVHQGYSMPMYDHTHASQMFSDENPNACSVM